MYHLSYPISEVLNLTGEGHRVRDERPLAQRGGLQAAPDGPLEQPLDLEQKGGWYENRYVFEFARKFGGQM